MTTMDRSQPITSNRIDTHGDGDRSGRELSPIIEASPVGPSPAGVMPAETGTSPACVSPCPPPYVAAMDASTNRPEDTRPTDEQIAAYRAKYGPPVPPTDLGEPEDPESFRALAAQLRGESG
jgi:hypothetical protein